MSKRYTRSELAAIGMDEKQINAILRAYEDETYENEISTISASNAKNVASINQAMRVTTATDLQSYAAGIVVRLPDFGDGQPFFARVRRPSMLVLAKQGKIPNSLLTTAAELFSKGGGGLDFDNENMLSDMYDIMDVIATAALIEPSMAEIKAAGLELTDDQMMVIFNYTQSGVKALEPFRAE